MAIVNKIGNIIGRGGVINYKGYATAIANNHETRVLDDGGTLPDKTNLINFLTDFLKATNDLKLNYLKVALDAHLFGYKATGTTVNKLYSLNYAYDTVGSALLLPWNSADGNYWLGGNIAGNRIMTTNSTATNIVRDFEFKCKINWPNSYTDGFHYGINSKWFLGSANNRQFSFEIQNNIFTILLSKDGINTTIITSNLNLLNKGIIWIKVTRNSVTGEIIVYTSSDGINYSNIYSLISITGDLFSGDSPISIGGIQDCFPGKVYEVSMATAISSNPSYYFNANDYNNRNSATPNQFISSKTGEVWTINNDTNATGYKGCIVTRNSVMFNGTSDYLRSTYSLAQPYTNILVKRGFVGALNKTCYDGNALNQGRQYMSTAGGLMSINAGTALGTVTPTLRVSNIWAAVFNGASSIFRRNKTAGITGNAGSSSLTGFTLGASGDLAYFGNIQFQHLLQISKALYQTTQYKIFDIIEKYIPKIMITGLAENLPTYSPSINIQEDGITYGGGTLPSLAVNITIQASWDSAMLDGWFNSYALVAPVVISKTLNFSGTNQAPTSASLTARNKIISQGFIILINS